MTTNYLRIMATGVLYLLFCCSMSIANEVAADDLVGVWLIEEGGEAVEKVEIYRCEEMYCGKIIWLKAPAETEGPATDKKNKSPELRDRPLLGLEVLRGYVFDGEDTWHDGEFYAYRKGKTVAPKLTLIDDNHLKIQVKILFIKKSFEWTRVVVP